MNNPDYFQKTLSKFTFDVASGDAIRHLLDRGFSLPEIKKMLDFPTPMDRIQSIAWDYLLEKGCIVTDVSAIGKPKEEVVYVTEYDAYGRQSFRKTVRPVTAPNSDFPSSHPTASASSAWNERNYLPSIDGSFAEFLKFHCSATNPQAAYLFCDFGLVSHRDPALYAQMLAALDPDDRAYVESLPWERKKIYHQLDQRMVNIAVSLYDKGLYHGDLYVVRDREILHINKVS